MSILKRSDQQLEDIEKVYRPVFSPDVPVGYQQFIGAIVRKVDNATPIFTSVHCKRIDELLLPLLVERERDVLKMYFGLNMPKITLEEIGAKFDLSRERIRQIKEKALWRNRFSSCLRLMLEGAPPVDQVSADRVKILSLGLPIKVTNFADLLGITFLDEFAKYYKEDLLKYRNFGKKSLHQIETALQKHGLSFRSQSPFP